MKSKNSKNPRGAGRNQLYEDKVIRKCIVLNPKQVKKIHLLQGKYMIKYGMAKSFSQIMNVIIANGLKITKMKDIKK